MGDHDGDQCKADCHGDWQGKVAMEMQVEWKKKYKNELVTPYFGGGVVRIITARGVSFQMFYFAWLEIPSFLFMVDHSFVC